MKQKDPQEVEKQEAKMSAVMAGALLFLSVVLARSASLQFLLKQTFRGWISVVGSILFFGVSLMMLNDLRKKRKETTKPQED